MSETLHNKGLHNSSFSALTRDAWIMIFGADHWSRPWEARLIQANGLFTAFLFQMLI